MKIVTQNGVILSTSGGYGGLFGCMVFGFSLIVVLALVIALLFITLQ